MIIQGIIPTFTQTTADGVATSGRALHAVRTVLHEEIVTVTKRSTSGVLKDPPVVNWKDTGRTVPVDRNTVGIPLRTTTQVRTGAGPSVPPISIESQKIEDPRRSIIPQEGRNSKPLEASINIIPADHRDPTPSWRKIIGSEKITNESADVYAHGRMKFGSDTFLSESPNFVDFGLSSVNTTDKIGSVSIPTVRIGRPKDGSNWLPPGNNTSEATADRVSRTKAKNHYNY